MLIWLYDTLYICLINGVVFNIRGLLAKVHRFFSRSFILCNTYSQTMIKYPYLNGRKIEYKNVLNFLRYQFVYNVVKCMTLVNGKSNQFLFNYKWWSLKEDWKFQANTPKHKFLSFLLLRGPLTVCDLRKHYYLSLENGQLSGSYVDSTPEIYWFIFFTIVLISKTYNNEHDTFESLRKEKKNLILVNGVYGIPSMGTENNSYYLPLGLQYR